MNFSQPQTVTTSISLPERRKKQKTNRHHTCRRRKGQEVHLFNIFSPLRYQSLSEDSNNDATVKERDVEDESQTGCLTERTKREKKLRVRGRKWRLDIEHPSRMFICCCLHRELGCTEAPLTCFSSVSRWVIMLLVTLRAWHLHRNLQLHTLLKEGGTGLFV